MATAEQLLTAISSGCMGRYPRKHWSYGFIEAVDSELYVCGTVFSILNSHRAVTNATPANDNNNNSYYACNLLRVVPLGQLEDFTVHHMPNKYVAHASHSPKLQCDTAAGRQSDTPTHRGSTGLWKLHPKRPHSKAAGGQTATHCRRQFCSAGPQHASRHSFDNKTTDQQQQFYVDAAWESAWTLSSVSRSSPARPLLECTPCSINAALLQRRMPSPKRATTLLRVTSFWRAMQRHGQQPPRGRHTK